MRKDFFLYYHFSLVISYHSVWLGLELFGLLHVKKRGAGNFGDFWKKQWVEICLWARLVGIWSWARRVQFVGYGMRARLLGQWVEILTRGREFSWGVDCGRCRNSQHSKNCVSVSLCRKPKSQEGNKSFVPELKKVVSVSGFLCIWIFWPYATKVSWST